MKTFLHSPIRTPSSTKFTIPTNPTTTLPVYKTHLCFSKTTTHNSSLLHSCQSFCKSLPLTAVSVALLLSASPAKAGFMSGYSGIESVPGPQLPQIDFLTRLNEENQKKYAENDERFKSSPIVKELLERSKLNKEKNRQAIQDKYCVRGAEWGVGDCSTAGMSPQERDDFISMLRQKTGITD